MLLSTKLHLYFSNSFLLLPPQLCFSFNASQIDLDPREGQTRARRNQSDKMLRSTQLIDDPKFVDTHLEHVHDLGILTVAHNPSQQWPQITGASRPMPRPLRRF